MKIGIVGPAGSGKTTLFEALAEGQGTAARPGEPGIATVKVHDPRLAALRDLFDPRKFTPATVQYTDFPPILGGERIKGRGGTAELVASLREVEAVACVIGAFQDPESGSTQWAAQLQGLVDELALLDLEVMEKRIDRLARSSLQPSPRQADEKRELHLLQGARERVEEGRGFGELLAEPEDRKRLLGYGFFLMKPLLGVINLAEGAAAAISETAPPGFAGWLGLCAELEREIGELPEENRGEFLEAMGLDEPAGHRFVRSCYDSIGLISFFTVGEDEVRAWTLRRGATALDAAAAIHSDLARGFIRAEVVPHGELLAAGSLKDAKTSGSLRLEGKQYEVADGDVVHIRFAT